MLEKPVHVKMLIGGKWTDGPDVVEVRNPAHPDEVVGTAIRGTQTDVEHASRRQRRLNVIGQGEASQSAPESYQRRLIGLLKELRTEHGSMRVRMAASSPRPLGELRGVPVAQRLPGSTVDHILMRYS
jgi:acyl-CoA reductase-like NAD-dependent aldehyde dehydrogenase